jgi:REP element-mobilizing transposase RayT/CheY-like chemotaxis protein
LEVTLSTYSEEIKEISKFPHGKPNILVVTPLTDLGELICESLKDVSNIGLFSNASKTISFIRQHEDFHQAILDMEMGEMRLLDLGRALRKINPTIELIIISKEEPSTDLDAIQPWKFIRKPILLRDLQVALGVSTVNECISSNIIDLDTEELYGGRAPLHWLNNPVFATRQLAQLIEKSSAQEALLIQNHALWSYSGKLSEESVQEVDCLITKSWDGKNKVDFMRFIKLETTQTEHALYATFIALGVILALVFDSEIPFSIVRSQTNELANTLLLPAGDDSQVKKLSWGNLESKSMIEEKPIFWKRLDNPSFSPDNDSLEIEPSRYVFKEFVDSRTSEDSLTVKGDQPQYFHPLGTLNNVQFPDGSIHSIQNSCAEKGIKIQDFNMGVENQERIILEPVSDGLYNLSYSCLLIPRFKSHHLSKDREKLISECMKEIYTSYGWRLESLETKPDYLKWVASIPPTIALSEHITIIRKETSKRLFDDFPPFKQENLSSDYWAPGYLIMGGNNTISDQLIQEYSNKSRHKYDPSEC